MKRKLAVKNSVIKKIPLGKKFRLFCDLDFKEQLIILIRFFAPLIVVAGLLKLYNADIHIAEGLIFLFIMAVMMFIPQEEQIEVISEENTSLCLFKKAVNFVLGIIYLVLALMLAVVLLHYGAKFLPADDKDMLICYYTGGGVICFVLGVWLILWKFKSKLFLKLPQSSSISLHYLFMEDKDFMLVKGGQKTIEFRLSDTKRKRIKVKDILYLTDIDDVQKSIGTVVTDLYYAADFKELLAQIDISKSGWLNAAEALEELNKLYDIKRQQKYGVIGIEFQPAEIPNYAEVSVQETSAVATA